nr:hypothetical protein [Tanacetum cinerariifolium]
MKENDAFLKNMQTNMTSLTNSNLELMNMFGQFMKMNTASSSGSGTLPSNTITNPNEDLKGITTQSGIACKGPTIPTTSSPPKVVERKTKVTKDTVPPTNNRSTKDVQPLVVQIKTPIPNSEPVVSPVVEPFGPTIKSLLTNKEKLFELARTPLNEHCSAVLLKKLPEKLGDHDKFLIPCDFSEMDECLALFDLDASINLMPLSVWDKLSLLELSPTCMTLELADRSISHPVGVAEDVFVKVGTFHFPTDFIVVDFDADPQVPLILAVTFNLDQTSRYSANYDAMSVNRIDLIDVACEEYSQEVLGFFEKGFTIAALKNEVRKLTGNSVNTKFAKPSILGKSVLQPLRNQSVVRQPNTFESERPKYSRPRFTSQVDVNNILSKPLTPHYLPKVRKSMFVNSNHVIAFGSSRNSFKELYGSNDMAHNHYLEEAKKKTQDKNMNLKPSVMHTTSLQNTTNGSKPIPRRNNQTSRSLPISKSSCEMSNDVNSRFKVQSPKTRNNIKPVEMITNVIKPKRWISGGYKVSLNKSFAVHEKPNTPRSCLRWKSTGRVFKTAGLRWIPTGKMFTD